MRMLWWPPPIIAAYRELVRCPERKRETVVRGLKEAHRVEQRQITIPAQAGEEE
jgi:hypothetical protein